MLQTKYVTFTISSGLSLDTKMWRTIFIIFTTLVIILFESSRSDDPLCVEALMNGTYDSCADSVNSFPDTWGICELNNCQDQLQLLLYTGGQQDKHATRKVIFL